MIPPMNRLGRCFLRFLFMLLISTSLAACTEPDEPKPEYDKLRTKLYEVFRSWREAEDLRHLNQYSLAKPHYEQTLDLCRSFLEAREGNDIIAKIIEDINTILHLEPMENAGLVELDGQWMEPFGPDSAVSNLLTRLKKEVAKKEDAARKEAEAMHHAAGIIRNDPRLREEKKTQEAIDQLLGHGHKALVHLAAFAEASRNKNLRVFAARLMGQRNAVPVRRDGSNPKLSPLSFSVEDYLASAPNATSTDAPAASLIGLLLMQMLEDEHADVVTAAAKAIGERKYEPALPELIERLHHLPVRGDAGKVKRACITAIAALDRIVLYPVGGPFQSGMQQISIPEAILPDYIFRLEEDPDALIDPKKAIVARAEIQRLALDAVGKIKSRRVQARMLRHLTTAFRGDPEVTVRAAAAEALGEIGNTEAALTLTTELWVEGSPIRREVIEALAKSGHYKAVYPMLQAIQFGHPQLQNHTMKMLELHARRDPRGGLAAAELGEIANTYNADVRQGALEHLAQAGTYQAIFTLISLTRSSDPLVALLAAERLNKLPPGTKLWKEHKTMIKNFGEIAEKQGRYQVAILLAKAVPEASYREERLQALAKYAIDPDRNLDAKPDTVCYVAHDGSEEQVRSAYGDDPMVLDRSTASAVGVLKILVYPYEGLAFHLRANQFSDLSKGFSVYAIEVLPNFNARFLGLQVGDPVQQIFETLGLPNTVRSEDGLDVLHYAREGRPITVYCDSEVRRIYYRNPKILGKSLAKTPSELTPIPRLDPIP